MILTDSQQERNNIVNRSQTGKLLVSPQKLDHIERSVAYHLGMLHRGFESGLYDENNMRNMDETHFVINFGRCTDWIMPESMDLTYFSCCD